MKQFIYLSVICMLVLSACTNSYKKGDKGLEYKIISDGKGKTIGYGNYMLIHIKQVYGGTKDSVLLDTRDFMPRIQVFDSVNTPLPYYKILTQMRRGDSLVIRLLTDSAFKPGKQEMPPFMKKGKYLYTHVKMVNFFETQEQADSAIKAEAKIAKPVIYKKQVEEIEKDLATRKEQIAADSKVIENYLAQHNIKATKTKWGTYISVVNEGTGAQINNDNIAMVNYTGRTLDSGKVFDSNVDPKFGHVGPIAVNLGDWADLILGWKDAILQMKSGTKAMIFIPSSLAYGESGKGNDIKPNQPLMFDMEVTEVTTEEGYLAKQNAMQQEMIKKIQEGKQPPLPTPTKPANK